MAGVKWSHGEESALQGQHIEFMLYRGVWAHAGTEADTLGEQLAIDGGSREKPRKTRSFLGGVGEWAKKEVLEKN